MERYFKRDGKYICAMCGSVKVEAASCDCEGGQLLNSLSGVPGDLVFGTKLPYQKEYDALHDKIIEIHGENKTPIN